MQELKMLQAHKKAVWTNVVKDNEIYTGSLDGTLRRYSYAPHWAEVGEPLIAQDLQKIYSLAFTQDQILAVGMELGSISLIDFSSEMPRKRKLEGHRGAVYSMCYIADSKRLISQSGDSKIGIWDIDQPGALHFILGVSDYVSTILAQSDYFVVTEAAKEDGQHKIGCWDIVRGIRSSILEGHAQHHARALERMDEHRLLSGGNDSVIKLWDWRAPGREKSVFRSHQGYVNALAKIDDLHFASTSRDRSIKIWDVRNARAPVDQEENAHEDWIQALVYDFSHQVLLSGSGDKTAKIWGGLSFSEPSGAASDPISLNSGSSQVVGGNDSGESDSSSDRSAVEGSALEKIVYSFQGVMTGDLELTLTSRKGFHLTFVKTILDLFQVLGILDEFNRSFRVVYGQKLLSLSLRLRDERVSLVVVESLIARFRQMGLSERHENPNALWFYNNNGGEEILNYSNYPASLKTFLLEEKAKMAELVCSYYQLFVEVGCGEMENLILRGAQLEIQYLGLDFSPTRIATVQHRIKMSAQAYPGVRVQCLNVLDINSLALGEGHDPSKTVLIFPFNVFGNLAPISLILAKLRQMSVSFILSIYKNDEPSLLMRQEYYQNCGYNTLTQKETDEGVVFSSREGLYTVAYDQDYLKRLIQCFGFNVDFFEATYGFVVHATPRELGLPICPPLSLLAETHEDLPPEASLDEMAQKGKKSSYYHSLINVLFFCENVSQKLREGLSQRKTVVALGVAAVSGLVVWNVLRRSSLENAGWMAHFSRS